MAKKKHLLFTRKELNTLLSPKESEYDWEAFLLSRGAVNKNRLIRAMKKFLYWNIIRPDENTGNFWMMIRSDSLLAAYLRGEFNDE